MPLTPLAGGWRRGRKALRLIRSPRFRRALRHGVGAAIEHRHLAAVRARTVIDVGANRGQFTLLALELFPEAQIFAFEPLAAATARLVAAIGQEPRVRLFRTALGARAEERAIFITERDDCSSLLAPTGAQTALVPDARTVASEPVTVAPLAAILSSTDLVAPSVLKIDVQGFEGEVLEGARPLLSRIEVVYLEASFCELYVGQPLIDDLIATLRDEGFRLAGVYNVLRGADGTALQADLDFRRPAACRR